MHVAIYNRGEHAGVISHRRASTCGWDLNGYTTTCVASIARFRFYGQPQNWNSAPQRRPQPSTKKTLFISSAPNTTANRALERLPRSPPSRVPSSVTAHQLIQWQGCFRICGKIRKQDETVEGVSRLFLYIPFLKRDKPVFILFLTYIRDRSTNTSTHI